jgi:hypothetical protein
MKQKNAHSPGYTRSDVPLLSVRLAVLLFASIQCVHIHNSLMTGTLKAAVAVSTRKSIPGNAAAEVCTTTCGQMMERTHVDSETKLVKRYRKGS